MKKNLESENEAARPNHHPPAPGWHHTDKFGDIFVSPDGIAWAVRQNGDRLVNVAVKLNPSDITKTTLLERRKQSIAKRSYRKRHGRRTLEVILPLSEVETMPKL